VSNLAYATFNMNEANRTNVPLRLYAILCGLLLIIAQYSIFGKLKADADNEHIDELLRKKSLQQEFFKDNIEAINRKCHDLKHEIAALRLMQEGEERDKLISDLESSVMLYDDRTKTGNETLDIILTEQRFKCADNHIDFTFMADGKLLDFINSVELYVLLGNALDNAIEAELKEDEEYRSIHLFVGAFEQMTLVRLENYFSGNLNYKAGSITTSKEDENSHGYGLKSIERIAKKYGGHMVVDCKDNRFVLSILF
jgi:sensor histidine kinase regulating citrate/malate metabolism